MYGHGLAYVLAWTGRRSVYLLVRSEHREI
jgi:hypothetical protein